jgi:hypothetical protein
MGQNQAVAEELTCLGGVSASRASQAHVTRSLAWISRRQTSGSFSAPKRSLPDGPLPESHRQPATRRGRGQVQYVGDPFLVDPPLPLHLYSHLPQLHAETACRAFLLEEVVDLVGFHEAITAGDAEGDAPPAIGDDRGQFVAVVMDGTTPSLIRDTITGEEEDLTKDVC